MPSGVYIHKPHSEEHRKHLRENRPDFDGKKNPMFGKHHSTEAKKKMRDARIGKSLSDETKKKIGDSEIGENHPKWKGGMYNYYHKRARELFATPSCEECSISLEEYQLNRKQQKFDMHCVSKDFKILEQWNWGCLCRNCHRQIS